jgi:hypothetical protein
VSGPQFFETRMGRQYFEVTLPELVRQISRLNDLLALGVEQAEKINTARTTGGSPDGPAATTTGQG